jgi:hypothetical protein
LDQEHAVLREQEDMHTTVAQATPVDGGAGFSPDYRIVIIHHIQVFVRH